MTGQSLLAASGHFLLAAHNGLRAAPLSWGSLARPGCLRGLVSRVRLRFRRSLAASSPHSGWPVLRWCHPGRRGRRARGDQGTTSVAEVGNER